jgi:MATE family multidrug resistance protein
MVPIGIAGAVAIRVAQERGAGQIDTLRPIVGAALGLGMLWLGSAAVLFGFFGTTLAGWITDDPAVIAVAASIFLVFAFSQVLDGIQTTMVGALRGLSDTGFPAMVSTLAFWVVGLPVGWVLARETGLGPAGVWAGFVVGLALAAIVLVWRFNRATEAARLPATAQGAPD